MGAAGAAGVSGRAGSGGASGNEARIRGRSPWPATTTSVRGPGSRVSRTSRISRMDGSAGSARMTTATSPRRLMPVSIRRPGVENASSPSPRPPRRSSPSARPGVRCSYHSIPMPAGAGGAQQDSIATRTCHPHTPDRYFFASPGAVDGHPRRSEAVAATVRVGTVFMGATARSGRRRPARNSRNTRKPRRRRGRPVLSFPPRAGCGPARRFRRAAGGRFRSYNQDISCEFICINEKIC